ncbi:MAG: GNAT family N-acetyltransferase, partial [Caldilineaceae bacterium]
MAITSRPFRVAQDYAPLRHLLNAAWAADPTPWLWPTVRLDSFRYGRYWEAERHALHSWSDAFRVWEAHEGGHSRLVAVAHPDGDNQICLQVEAGLRAAGAQRATLEGEMLDWFAAEGRSQASVPAPLETMVYQHDRARQEFLIGRGWQNEGPCELTRRLRLSEPPPPAPLPAGFTLRTLHLDDPTDLEQMADVTNAVFPDAQFVAETWHVLANAPTWYEDWVAVAPTGDFASFCGMWVEPGLRSAWFEPVGTHPNFRRQGVARALM